MKSFFVACDTGFDDRISLEELQQYALRHHLPLSPDIISEMFHEITSHRTPIHEYQRNDPVTLEEIAAAVRGRHKWNTVTKEWEVTYRSTRDYWILMLQTISSRIFAMPVPKVVPTKILAQFEQEEDTMRKIREGTFSMSANKKGKAEGLERKYLSVKEKEEPTYKKDLHKVEAKVIP